MLNNNKLKWTLSAFEIVFIIVACLIALIPYLWTFLSGFKVRTDILSTSPKLFFTPTLENFPKVFIENGFLSVPEEFRTNSRICSNFMSISRYPGWICFQ